MDFEDLRIFFGMAEVVVEDKGGGGGGGGGVGLVLT